MRLSPRHLHADRSLHAGDGNVSPRCVRNLPFVDTGVRHENALHPTKAAVLIAGQNTRRNVQKNEQVVVFAIKGNLQVVVNTGLTGLHHARESAARAVP